MKMVTAQKQATCHILSRHDLLQRDHLTMTKILKSGELASH